jgi:hypothetical protein
MRRGAWAHGGVTDTTPESIDRTANAVLLVCPAKRTLVLTPALAAAQDLLAVAVLGSAAIWFSAALAFPFADGSTARFWQKFA